MEEDEIEFSGNIERIDELHYLTQVRDSVFPRHDLLLSRRWSRSLRPDVDDEESDAFTSAPFDFSPPLPLSSVEDATAWRGDDHARRIVDAKDTWKRNVLFAKTAYARIPKKRKMHRLTAKSSTARIPSYLYTFTALLREDPDPYFDAPYNWYMTGGGNLHAANGHLFKSIDDRLHITRVNSDLEEVAVSNYTTDNIINETFVTDTNIIGLRQKYFINLLKFDPTQNDNVIAPLKVIKSEIPICSFGVVDDDIYYASVDESLYVQNFEADEPSKISSVDRKEICCNKWTQMLHVDKNAFLFSTPDRLVLFDRRTDALNTIITPVKCNKIITAKMSSNYSNHLYVGMAHELQMFDLRIAEKPLEAWTHGLAHLPQYISQYSLPDDDEQLLVINGYYMDESCMILNSKRRNYLQWHPPSIKDTYKTARERSFCLDPVACPVKRLEASRVGNCFVQNGTNNIDFLTLNVCGDTFYHTWNEGTPRVDDGACEKLEKWFYGLPKSILKDKFTHSMNLERVYKQMQRSGKPKFKHRAPKDFHTYTIAWKNHIETLSDYTDIYAQDLLQVWQ